MENSPFPVQDKYHENFLKGSYDTLSFVLETECYSTINFCKINPFQKGVKT